MTTWRGASFLRRRAAGRATRCWKVNTASRNRGTRTFRLSGPKSKSKFRPSLRTKSKAITGRFYQLLSGGSVIAPFLLEKWGWIESDLCCWCDRERQSREHLFNECQRWEREMHRLWERVGNISGEWKPGNQDEHTLKSRREIGYSARTAKANLTDAPVGEPMWNDART